MMDQIKGRLTILADNTVLGKTESLGESGFSVYLETEYGNTLFDAGRGTTVVHNSIVHRKNLQRLDRIIISHGHPDHCGGLYQVLGFHDKIDVLGHPDIFLNRFRKGRDGAKRYGGFPHTRGYLERSGAVFSFNEEFAEIGRGTYLSGEIPRETEYEHSDMENRFAVRDGQEIVDTIADDQSLIMNTENGILIVLGCAHSGIINIINHALRLTGTDDIYCIVGGTHLGFADEGQLTKTMQALKAYNIRKFIPAHCTGIPTAARLVHELPECTNFSYVGMTLEF